MVWRETAALRAASWLGYRKVGRLVGKRLNRRLAELGLADLGRVDAPRRNVPNPDLAFLSGSRRVRRHREAIAVGNCSNGQRERRRRGRMLEHRMRFGRGALHGGDRMAFSVAQDWPTFGLTVIATDADKIMIERAGAACYSGSSLKDLPQGWVDRAFVRRGPLCCLAQDFRQAVGLALQDIRQSMPNGPFDLILCRNLVFTYFDVALQRRISDQLRPRLRPGGFLVLGSHEALLDRVGGFVPVVPKLAIYRREA
jgi:chemotaxis protein methyltransferase CheR